MDFFSFACDIVRTSQRVKAMNYNGYRCQDFNFLCHNCGFGWIAPLAEDRGDMVAISGSGEECPECGSDEIETTGEYHGA